MKKKISVLGCGWYGFALAKKLIENGYSVKGSTTTEEKLEQLADADILAYLVKFENNVIDYDAEFFDCDILFIAIPPKSKSPALGSYASKIQQIATAAEKNNVKQIILISSTGVYEDGNFLVDETVVPAPDAATGLALLEAENSLINNAAFTTTIIRFAGLIGPGRNLAKHFAGKIDIANGLAPINLIHLTDCLGLSLAIIKQNAFGKHYHGVSPSHLTRKSFYTKACEASGFEKPIFLNEKLNWKQIESKNVSEFLGYEYVYNDWDKYFNELKSE